MNARISIPQATKRKVLVESGHRCAIPACKQYPVEVHHIIPYEKCKEHKFENLIALCCTCHARYHRYRDIDLKSLQIYKANLGLLNSRYGEFERRVLQKFFEEPHQKSIRLPGCSEISVLYLIKDEFLIKSRAGPHINGSPSWEEYTLTEKGRQFIENWKRANPLD